MSNWLLEFIKANEGFRSEAYQDSVGVWTIGYGTTRVNGRKVAPGDKMSHEEALAYLKQEIEDFKRNVLNKKAQYGYDWNDNQVDALTSFSYNLGKGSIDQVTKNGTRDDKEIAGKILLYNKAGGRKLPGLVTRRKKEADHFNSKGQDRFPDSPEEASESVLEQPSELPDYNLDSIVEGVVNEPKGKAGWGFTSLIDMFDGGGAGASGDFYTGGIHGDRVVPKRNHGGLVDTNVDFAGALSKLGVPAGLIDFSMLSWLNTDLPPEDQHKLLGVLQRLLDGSLSRTAAEGEVTPIIKPHVRLFGKGVSLGEVNSLKKEISKLLTWLDNSGTKNLADGGPVSGAILTEEELRQYREDDFGDDEPIQEDVLDLDKVEKEIEQSGVEEEEQPQSSDRGQPYAPLSESEQLEDVGKFLTAGGYRVYDDDDSQFHYDPESVSGGERGTIRYPSDQNTSQADRVIAWEEISHATNQDLDWLQYSFLKSPEEFRAKAHTIRNEGGNVDPDALLVMQATAFTYLLHDILIPAEKKKISNKSKSYQRRWLRGVLKNILEKIDPEHIQTLRLGPRIEQFKGELNSVGDAARVYHRAHAAFQSVAARNRYSQYNNSGGPVLNMADGGCVKRPALNMENGGVVSNWWDKITSGDTSYRTTAEDAGLSSPHMEGPLSNPDRTTGVDVLNKTIDFVPIVGDIKAAVELGIEVNKTPMDRVAVAALTAALVIGLVPGVGDALAKPIKAAIMKSGELIPADVLGIVRAVKDGDVEFLKGWGVPEHTAALSARPSKMKVVLMRTPDGEIIEMQGPQAAEAIADATGYSKKTIQNKIADGKPIKGDDGTVWAIRKDGENRPDEMLFDTEDLRKLPKGSIIGPDGSAFDGSLKDLYEDISPSLRNQSIEEALEKFPWADREHLESITSDITYDGFRKKLHQGHTIEGFRLKDAPEDPYAKQKADYASRKDKGRETQIANTKQRIESLGLDSNDKELVHEFNRIWKMRGGDIKSMSHYVKGVPRSVRSDAMTAEANRQASEGLLEGVSEARHEELMKLQSKAGRDAVWEKARLDLYRKIERHPKFTAWRKFFLKYLPEEMEGLSAKDQRIKLYEMLNSAYIRSGDAVDDAGGLIDLTDDF